MSKKIKTEYKVGDDSEAGEKITCIIGSHTFFAVFTVKDDEVRWEVDDEMRPKHLSKCLEMYDKLDNLIHTDFSKEKHRVYRISNGRSLFASVTSDAAAPELTAFELIHDRIISEIQTSGRIKYVTSSTLLTIIVCLAVAMIASRII